MITLGICFGATSVQYTVLKDVGSSYSIIDQERIVHEGNPGLVLQQLLEKLDVTSIDRVAVTGRKFRNNVSLTSISEPLAIELGLQQIADIDRFPNLVVSLGGETQLVYTIGKQGGISSVHTGNKCASGTGEFFLQQIRRMDLSIEQAVDLGSKGIAHKIAGRCSVFCKSDCTHSLNKGEPKENIVAGLCAMIAEKIADLIKDMQSDRVMLIGGGALNHAVVAILSKRFPGVYVPANAISFESFGAALYAQTHECKPVPKNPAHLIHNTTVSFGFHPPLQQAQHLVDFKQQAHAHFDPACDYVLGLDVGSTTTKAVLLNRREKTIATSVYLRTNGDPVSASKKCYKAIHDQIGGRKATIVGLGVTGSGRQIAGLHALTDIVVNEIIAHATAATWFDPDVDTIFEIGGQDAKYTRLIAGVPSDYAMNEACSAGTGSFLEESAHESLNVSMEAIGPLAMQGGNPPNFSDQCAAFISSDIKVASQEGIVKNDILAGLVYSICQNYLNRVKGSRTTGKKIFIQGGVCYNTAVPVAMASLLQAPVIVPPDPGLMGALGVALEAGKRLSSGFSIPGAIDLLELSNREAVKESSFVCAGGKEKCDRKCEINRIRIGNVVHPFGGMCNKYYNVRLSRDVDAGALDLVAERERLLLDFSVTSPATINTSGQKPTRTVGILRSFLTHSLYPLYSHFFNEIGLTVELSDAIDAKGISRIESAYCLPAELSHGSFYNLLKKDIDYIFVPQVMQLPVKNVPTFSRLCVFVQGEPYYLKTTFRHEIESSGISVLSPVLKMEQGYMQAQNTIVAMAALLGIEETCAKNAWQKACDMQTKFEEKLRQRGREVLAQLEQTPDRIGLILFGRPYNTFTSDANMGIPHKIASRGYVVIPHDMLSSDEFPVNKQMFWAMGQKILKSAQFVKKHPQLFGVYITNFSCGPDSFLLSFFRNIMQEKPSLTLELDQHTADAGIDTRVEAAIDIMQQFLKSNSLLPKKQPFVPAKVESNRKELMAIASDGRALSLHDEFVEVILPSMGRFGTEGIAAVMRGVGIRAKALPVSTKEILNTGRKNTSCKECLPYILCTGGFLDYLRKRKDPKVMTLLFMASGGGPCRLGQYCTAMEQVISEQEIENVAMLAMTNENGYAGLGTRALLSAAQATIVADVFSEIQSYLVVAARDKENALATLDECWNEVLRYFDGSLKVRLPVLLTAISKRLKNIPRTKELHEVPVVALIGEIYVRQDEFSRQSITSFLEKNGIRVKIAPVMEYLFYSNYVVNRGLGEKKFSIKDHMKMRMANMVEEWWERRIKSCLSKSGCYKFEMIHVEKTMDSARHLINENFRGECILTVGLGLREIAHGACGVVSMGPFGCMPSRVAEAVLKKEMNIEGNARLPEALRMKKVPEGISEFPFLSIETDGSPSTQIVEANLEAFVVQAQRLHDAIKGNKRILQVSAKAVNQEVR